MKSIESKIKLISEELLRSKRMGVNEYLVFEMKKIGIEKLPYSYSSLSRFIDSKTMDIHYNKHYKGYVDKLNKVLSKKDYGDLELEEIVRKINRYNKTIRNNAGGAFNHALFWKMLSSKEQEPNGAVYEKIVNQFESYSKFKKLFEKVAIERFGSGWVWLVLTKRGTLKIMSTPNQDNPLMNIFKNGGYPLLGLDLWEHSYYLKYQNKRDEYIKNFWSVINWDFINKLYEMKINTKINETIVLRQVLKEQSSTKCTWEMINNIKSIFNINPQVKHIFKNGINKILKDVFPEHHYDPNEYAPDTASGVYDLEMKGRSVINKLNTNYTCFCILLNDVNKVLSREGNETIGIVGLTPIQQISQVRKFIKIIDEYKFRIFSETSVTFKNIMETLKSTHKLGDIIEDLTIKILKNHFGEENVTKVGELGNIKDMNEGIDCEIVFNSIKYTSQIKPCNKISTKDGKIIIEQTSQVKPYKTDWLIFLKNNKTVYIFKNESVTIVPTGFVFPEENLIFTLD
jgi:Fe-Mn family superoxide dismutase